MLSAPSRAALAAVLVALIAPAGAAEYVVAQAPGSADDGPGSAERPFATIARAVRDLKPGDRLRIRGGVYRESFTIAASGTAEQPISIVADPGVPVVVTGADRVQDLHREQDGRWWCPWTIRFDGAHPEDPYHRLIGRAEQVLVNRYPLTQVERPEQVVPGTFCADLEAKRLWVMPLGDRDLAENGGRVEASTRGRLMTVGGAYVHVRGLRFRYAANRAQDGMVVFEGDHALVEDCVFERANALGVSFRRPDIEVRRCAFLDNGQMGFGASDVHRLHLSDCVVRGNNTKDWSRNWEAGGLKIVMAKDVVLERCRIEANRGVGVWFDIGNENATVRNCLLVDNEDAGLFYEISFGLHAHDNVVVGNGLAETPGSWAMNGGIALSSSPGCVIERNLLVGNIEGFQYREQARTTPRIGVAAPEEAVWNHDQRVRHNLFAWNREGQTWGWFDVADERHWPKAMQERKPEQGKAAADSAADYHAKDDRGQPIGLSLDQLKLDMGENAFVVAPHQQLFNWGCHWHRNIRYPDLDRVRAELGLEQGSVVLDDLPFADPLTRDFRLPAGHPALKLGCYPQGEVPGATLGALPPSAAVRE